MRIAITLAKRPSQLMNFSLVKDVLNVNVD